MSYNGQDRLDLQSSSSVSTPAAEAMKTLIATVQPVLKELGFRRRGSSLNRTVAPDGLVHVINVQRGGYIRLHAADMFGLAPRPYGGFTVNLGVWLPGVRLSPLDPPDDMTGKTISEAQCRLRNRLGQLLPEPADIWWPLDAEGGELARTALTEYGLPWLGRFSTWDDTLSQLEGDPDSWAWLGPPWLIAMGMRLARAERDEAERDFAEHLRRLSRPEQQELPGFREALAAHFDMLEKIAMANYFTVDVRAYAATASDRDPV
jgi:hypothetical protein